MPRPTRDTARLLQDFAYGAITHYGQPFQTVQLSIHIPHRGPTTPVSKPTGLGCSRFARRYSGNLFRFLFLWLLRCFNSPRSPLHPMYSGADDGRSRRVSPFGHPRIKAYFPAPRGFSQVVTSFIAAQRQGIHHGPLFT